MHYINQNEDVLISLDNNITEGFYEIPNIDSYWSSIITSNNLYIAAKCNALAHTEFPNECTVNSENIKWLEKHGYVYHKPDYNKNWDSSLGFYTNYDVLSLSCFYGGNKNSFDLLKPFIIPKSFLLDLYADYKQEKVEAFIAELIQNENIKFYKF